MLKKISLSQFDKQQLAKWDAALRFGFTQPSRLKSLQLSLFFLGSVLLVGFYILPSKYNFSIDWLSYIILLSTVCLFIYTALVLLFNKRMAKSTEGLLVTLNLGFGALWITLFFQGLYLLMTNVYFAENAYTSFSRIYKSIYPTISILLFILLWIFFLLGYLYDIIWRTKTDKVRKLTDSEREKGISFNKNAMIGAFAGIIVGRFLMPGEIFLSVIMLLFSYLIIFFVPRIFILAYLQYRFPEDYLVNHDDEKRNEDS